MTNNSLDKPDSTTPSENRSGISFKRALIVSGVAILAMLVLTAVVWTKLSPDAKIPIHWNAAGEIDGWAGRGALFMMPGMVAVVVLIFTFFPLIEPRRGHLLRSSKAYQAVWFATIGFFGILHGVVAWAALGNPVQMNAVMGIALGLLFIVIGNFMGKVRSNYVMGFRTPWTLASELSWNKTHRLGGRLFVALGFALLVGGLWNPGEHILWIILIPGIVILIGWTFVYSYLIWKDDPNKDKRGR